MFDRLVAWEYGDILADYVLGETACALYLSIRYHLLHPKYLLSRLNSIKSLFRTRVLLCHVDQVKHVHILSYAYPIPMCACMPSCWLVLEC
jgi:DNA excision repair protein ERCC-1